MIGFYRVTLEGGPMGIDADNRHSCGKTGVNTCLGVFKDDTSFGGDLQERCSLEVDLGVGLAVSDLLAVDGESEVVAELGRVENEVDVGCFGVGCDGFGKGLMEGEEIANSGDQLSVEVCGNQFAIEGFFISAHALDVFECKVGAEEFLEQNVVMFAVHAGIECGGIVPEF